MPLSQRFRTPYREKSHMGFESGRETDNDVNHVMHVDGAGDMLDLIGRPQKSTQSQQRPNKAVKVKLVKKTKTKQNHSICSAPKSSLRVEPGDLRNTPLQDSETVGITLPMQALQSSEIYDFPESPNQDRKRMKRDFNRRMGERQVLRTIQKMAEELKILRLRQQRLRRSHMGLLV